MPEQPPGGSRLGVPNKSTARARELFAPHVATAIQACIDIIEAKREAKESQDYVAKQMAPRDSDVIAAAKIILEYGLGKPRQPISGSDDPDDMPVSVTVKFA